MKRGEHVVSADEQGRRIDALLALVEPGLSRSAAVQLIEQGQVSVDGIPVRIKRRVMKQGETLVYLMMEDADRVPRDLLGESIPLDIRYEDGYLLVLSKQAGLVCHPAPGHEEGTLVNALIAHCGADGLATLQGGDRPGIVHRLDMDTSGLMLAAKDDATGNTLQDALRDHSLDRRYLALVHGSIAPQTGQIDAPIGRDERTRMKMRVSDAPSAREAVTTFKVLERFEAGSGDEGYTLVECKLLTGRTHQIRVHMAYIKHPCVGDPLYGWNRPKAERGLERQFLHSYSLTFLHPVLQETMSFIDPLPADLDAFLQTLYREGRSMGRTADGDRIFSALDARDPALLEKGDGA